jgi:hypothetical protein
VHKLDKRDIEMNMDIVGKRFISKIINHPDYETYQNDLVILRLSQPVYIRYLCILPNDNRIDDVHLDSSVEIVSWGYINKI